MLTKKTAILQAIAFLLCINSYTQTITPDPNTNLFCPGTIYTFTVVLPTGQFASTLNVNGVSVQTSANGITYNTKPAIVNSGPTNITYPNGSTTRFTFTGSFYDDNTPQSFQVYYVIGGVNNYANFIFTKIESFLVPYGSISTPAPSPSSITAPRCQVNSFPVSFSNVSLTNNIPGTPNQITTATQYQYQLPNGWSIGGVTSTGSNWITSSNNVTVTSELSNGDGGYIYIRAVNPCDASLVTGPQGQIAISRPAPGLSISGPTNICSGTADFTINGMPTGSSVAWSVSDPSQASITAGASSPTVTVSRVGTANSVMTLTATVTHCTFTYPVTYSIELGTPPPNPITVLLVDPAIGRIQVMTDPPLKSATSYNWYKDGVLQTISHGSAAQIPITIGLCDVGYGIEVEAISTCGTSSRTYQGVYVPPCPSAAPSSFVVSPNPANNAVIVTANETSSGNSDVKDIQEIKIFDMQGNLKKLQKFNKTKSVTISVSDLKTGNYIIEISGGGYKENKHLSIKK